MAALSRLGAKNLWGVDINPAALTAANILLCDEAPLHPRHLFMGDLFSPLDLAQQFDLIVANLPHFPANVIPPDRPPTWTGGQGRDLLHRFIHALPSRLAPHGIALMTHHDLVGFQSTLDCIHNAGLYGETVSEWTVFEPPDRVSAVTQQIIDESGKSMDTIGGYTFFNARILAITANRQSFLQQKSV